MAHKKSDMDILCDAINEKAVFYSNLVRSQKLTEKFDQLQQAYVKNAKQSIKGYASELINAYKHATDGTSVDPKKLTYITAAIDNYRYFRPFMAVAKKDINSNGAMLKHLLSYNFESVDPKTTLINAVPVLMLDKLVTLIKKEPDPVKQYEIFKFALNSQGPYIQGKGSSIDTPMQIKQVG